MAVSIAGTPVGFTNPGTNSLTMTKPTGLTVGDIIFALVSWAASSTGSPSLPSGWAVPSNGAVVWQSSNSAGLYLATKVATSADVAASSFTFGSTSSGTKYGIDGIIGRITGADTTASVLAANQTTTSTSTGTFPSVTTTTADWLVLLAGFQAAGATPSGSQWDFAAPSGTTMVASQDNPSNDFYLGLAAYTAGAAGATGTKTVPIVTASAAARFQAITVAFKPTPPPSTTPNDAAHAQVASSPALAPNSAVAPNGGGHAQAATSPHLASNAAVSPADADHGQSATSPSVAVRFTVTPADAVHAQGASEPTTAAAFALAPDDGFHAHTATEPMLTAKSVVSPADTTHAQTATAPSINVGGQLVEAPASRTVVVATEARLVSVGAEVRAVAVGRENRSVVAQAPSRYAQAA